MQAKAIQFLPYSHISSGSAVEVPRRAGKLSRSANLVCRSAVLFSRRAKLTPWSFVVFSGYALFFAGNALKKPSIKDLKAGNIEQLNNEF
jgi:hypothetical protein